MLKQIFIIAVSFIGITSRAKAADHNSEEIKTPFSSNLMLLETQKNFPMTYSQNWLEGGHPYPSLSYRHSINGDWLMGVGGTFKILKFRDGAPYEDQNLAIWTVHHEATKIIRVSHPTYLLAGTKILYMIPAKKHSIPLQKRDPFQTEIGFALTASVLHILDDQFMASIRVDRYRGTKTQLFQGLEIATGITYAIK